jgi:thiol:disulfide interchange protein DsbC
MKKLAVFCLCALWIPNGAAANEATVKLAMQKRYPDIPVESVARTPIAGLYEVFTVGEVLYVDDNAS